MRTAADVSPEKLRGGFYTPPRLVAFCLRRAAELVPVALDLRLLEPSAGDGAFLRGLAICPLRPRLAEVHAVEVRPEEAALAERALQQLRLPGTVTVDSVLNWAVQAPATQFDLAVGNPPFVRFQFIDKGDRANAQCLARQVGVDLRGVSNLWILVLLAALTRLRQGGVFSFVVPTELLSGLSAQTVRDWFLSNTDGLRLDLFPPGSFPGVLQEVAVVTGRRTPPRQGQRVIVSFTEHDRLGGEVTWQHPVQAGLSWIRYLLHPSHLEALTEVRGLPLVASLADVADFQVSIVTGANDFFSVDAGTLAKYDLQAWARPLLPRIRHARGLIYTHSEHLAVDVAGARSWLLDFSPNNPDPKASPGARRYLSLGEELRLPERYKCRVRSPWYRVPGIKRGELLLSKRSHRYPRVIENAAQVFTTDTIYRGRILPGSQLTVSSFVAAFHNSLTLATAELEGRTFGGGVLELVPSEIRRVLVPVVPQAARWLPALDRASRSSRPERLVEETDRRLVASGMIPQSLLVVLQDAAGRLRDRRLERAASSFDGTREEEGLAAA